MKKGNDKLELEGIKLQKQCAKNMRNGPCAGIRQDGCCEVDEKKTCVWMKYFYHLKAKGRQEEFLTVHPRIPD